MNPESIPSSSHPKFYFVAEVIRVLLGLVFLVFGLNGFFNFIPQPKDPMPAGATAFIMALVQSGYMIKLVSGTQVIAGLLLLSRRFVPLGLLLLAPVVVNIVAFHLFLAPKGLALGVVVLVLELYLAWTYKTAFRPVLTSKTNRG